MSVHETMLAFAGCAAAVSIGLCGGAFAADPQVEGGDEPPDAADDAWERDRTSVPMDGIHAIGRLIGSMHCTGTLVLDPRIVVTAAHCVAASDGKTVVAQVSFRPNGSTGMAQAAFDGSVWAIGSPHQQAPQLAHEAANDWAVVVLHQAPTGIRPLRVRSHSIRELRNLVGRVHLPEHPDRVAHAGASRAEPACSVLGVLWNVILHDCRAPRGGSGTPLLVWDGDRLTVIGIHTGGVAFRATDQSQIVLAAGSAVRAIAFLTALRKVQERLVRRDEAALRACVPTVTAGAPRCSAG